MTLEVALMVAKQAIVLFSLLDRVLISLVWGLNKLNDVTLKQDSSTKSL